MNAKTKFGFGMALISLEMLIAACNGNTTPTAVPTSQPTVAVAMASPTPSPMNQPAVTQVYGSFSDALMDELSATGSGMFYGSTGAKPGEDSYHQNPTFEIKSGNRSALISYTGGNIVKGEIGQPINLLPGDIAIIGGEYVVKVRGRFITSSIKRGGFIPADAAPSRSCNVIIAKATPGFYAITSGHGYNSDNNQFEMLLVPGEGPNATASFSLRETTSGLEFALKSVQPLNK